jgi:hypothetical protein
MTREEARVQLKLIKLFIGYDENTLVKKMQSALDLAIKVLEQHPRDCKTCKHSDKGNCAGTEECHECMWSSKYEQQPSDNEEIIRVSKGAVKARQGRFVIYDTEWLKEHFNTTEAKLYGQPCEDCISRQEAIDAIKKIHPVDTEYDCTLYDKIDVMYMLKDLPSVTPHYNLEPYSKRLWKNAYERGKADALEKIKAEIIEKFDNCSICEWFEDYDYDENDISEYISVGHISDIIEIINKYKAESEDAE